MKSEPKSRRKESPRGLGVAWGCERLVFWRICEDWSYVRSRSMEASSRSVPAYTMFSGRGPGSNHASPGGLPGALHRAGSGQWGSLGSRLCDKTGYRAFVREGSRERRKWEAGLMVNLGCEADPVIASAHPLGTPAVGMVLHSCPKLQASS